MNLFLLERLYALQIGSRTSDLLRISFEMVDVALVFWKYKDRLTSFLGEFEWLVSRDPLFCIQHISLRLICRCCPCPIGQVCF